MSALKTHIAKVATGSELSFEEAREAFDIIMSGDATPGQIGGFLMALRVRGEAVSEISGAVATMRAKMLRVEAPRGAIDIVGTGGDNSHSVNISTASAFVIAAAGVPVAKHGNRGLSSLTGSADVLMALGVKIDISPETIGRCIHEAGVGFMFAPAHHPAMKHVGPIRGELGTRTIFNLLGPLSNPAGVSRQMVGVFLPEWIMPVAETLKALGADHAWVVHGDGYDEITTTGETQVAELAGGEIRSFTLTPEAVRLKRHTKEELRGGDAAYNAKALRDMLGGAAGAYRDTVLMNAGAGLVVAGKATTLADGIAAAAQAIDSGRALAVLDKLIEISNG
ncbi:anthranilate phosphoribosyltransferase [Mesorhizobium sp. M1C.F.Ca.ET.193.01.1.1]|uniref:anthranilate phosphoribosyltransferase n=1 Tax=unclassified Mesorhizobium TaxID=325217 RepID=UPI000FD6160A|nr:MULTISPECIES: anthranilate phosphoribosyltransferase [unclassified Mesorhizobium]TGT03498.1 anthranilate phosphoribosyltransferase [bacterium M00.F.Ca.ET.177.01.1.1]TGQ56182.1 anthranilate phosphoribosyltransferase [Mesorhizobium sp. M1C.F.Ca.ET.210.01.1.1]TGQ75267.1 anthranilate phosphoribosyltransferase [Mesorhizobium sp. M1C.F.Ca.ET.212.01.1.1]TGR13679.1 anthranilate phosphoribosyltransferase [Mesorhizobium sp. M1C.F.Ca.ET.204.01.1.1]TGR33954.1 anthranilate phosphoribosyltransferase [Mes